MNYAEGAGRLRKPRGAAELPPAVSLNAPANQVSANNHIFPGFFAGFLGSRFDPLFDQARLYCLPRGREEAQNAQTAFDDAFRNDAG